MNKYNDFALCNSCLIKDTESENEICCDCDSGQFYQRDEEFDPDVKNTINYGQDIYIDRYNYNTMKVMYLLGRYYADDLDEVDYEDIVKLASKIIDLWDAGLHGEAYPSMYNCKDSEEEGYVQKYFERVGSQAVEDYLNDVL